MEGHAGRGVVPTREGRLTISLGGGLDNQKPSNSRAPRLAANLPKGSTSSFCQLQATLDALEPRFNSVDAIGHRRILLLENADPSFNLAQIIGNSIELLVELAQ